MPRFGRTAPCSVHQQSMTMVVEMILLAMIGRTFFGGISSLPPFVLVTASAVVEEREAHPTGGSTHTHSFPPDISLRDGSSMPRVGLGVALTAEKTYEAVSHAINLGYRLVDTAAEESYGNEDQVGEAIDDYRSRTKELNIGSGSGSNSKKEEEDGNGTAESAPAKIFVTTKLWDTDHGFDNTLRAFWKSYQELNKFHVKNINGSNDSSSRTTNQPIPIDLYLVHSPYGGRLVETWDALLWLQKHHSDKLKSIGVSNFGVHHLEVLRKAGRPMPVVNQIEMHPLVYSQRRDLLEYCEEHGIAVQAFGSLMHGYSHFLEDPPEILSAMVDRYNESTEAYATYHSDNDVSSSSDAASNTITTAHVLLQWALQHGFAIIPKSSKTQRITDNVRYIDLGTNTPKSVSSRTFSLTEHDLQILDAWGDHVPYDYRNIYKEDWNWNPIDEAPLHYGHEDYWPKYSDIKDTHLEAILQNVEDERDNEEEYWNEYWTNGEYFDDDDDEEDEDEDEEEDWHEEL